jgi:hypothetical protein
MNSDHLTQPTGTAESLSTAPRFPTMLRKMWSGGEVQAWIDRHWPAPLPDKQAMCVVINACDSLNITRVHEIGGKTRTICDEAGLLEIVRAVEAAHGIASA